MKSQINLGELSQDLKWESSCDPCGDTVWLLGTEGTGALEAAHGMGHRCSNPTVMPARLAGTDSACNQEAEARGFTSGSP